LLTRYIKNWADGAEIEWFNSHLTLCGLTDLMLRNAQLFIHPTVSCIAVRKNLLFGCGLEVAA